MTSKPTTSVPFNQDDILEWADGTWCYRHELAGMTHMSDDYTTIPEGTEAWNRHEGGCERPSEQRGTSQQRCTLGVGCDEASNCYAESHGQPEQCGRPSPFKFEVGKTYLTQRGEQVRVVFRQDDLRGYETVLCDDGAYRYDRSTHDSDAGRCTGTEHDYSHPDNFARPTQEVAEPAPHAPTPAGVLARGLELISAPGGWGKGRLFPGFSDSSVADATCFCALGATHRASHDLQLGSTYIESRADQFLRRALIRRQPGAATVSEYNDHPDTKLAGVQALFAEAIRLARAEGGVK